MSFSYIIDAYAWIEYFKASKMGEAAKEFIEGERSVTPTIVVSEISRKLRRDITLGNETREGRIERLEFIRATSRVVDLDFETAVEAGSLNEDLKIEAKDWGLADSIVLCTARKLKGKVVTGDEHFRHLDDVIFIKPQYLQLKDGKYWVNLGGKEETSTKGRLLELLPKIDDAELRKDIE